MQIGTSNAIVGNLTVTNYNDNSEHNNAIEVPAQLKANGTITLINQEAAILVDQDGFINASKVVLNAQTNLTINGSVSATNETELRSSGDLSLGGTGTVSGRFVNAVAGQDFIHNGGTISSERAVITAARNVQLQSGDIQATNASVTATSGAITENNGYVVNAGTLNVAAGQGIEMSSEANKLKNVVIDDAGASVTIVSGNDAAGDLNVSTAQGTTVNGSISVTNVAIGSTPNKIVVDKALQARGDITLTNKEADIDITEGGTINSDHVIMNAANDILLNGGTVDSDNVSITATNDVLFNSSLIDAETMLISSSNGVIKQNCAADFVSQAVLNVDNLLIHTAKAADSGWTVYLGSKTNNFASIKIYDTAKGNMLVGSGKATNGNVTVGLAYEDASAIGQLDGSLTVYNHAVGEANAIVVDDVLKASGSIDLINKETDVKVDGGSIAAVQFNINAVKDIVLNRGRLVAGRAELAASGAINEADGFALDASTLIVSANNDISLDSKSNQLELVNVEQAGNNVIIGSANGKNDEDLRINTANKVAGDLRVTNYKENSGYNNAIKVPTQLYAGGSITLTNEEATIKVAQDATINADANVVLNTSDIVVAGTVNAHDVATLNASSVDVDGIIRANTVYLESSGDLHLNGTGTVNANTVNASAEQDFIHMGSTIAAANVALSANRNILLQGGKIQATDATMSSVGYIAETYDNALTNFNGYDLQVANDLTMNAANSSGNTTAIDLDSKFNQLYNVIFGASTGDVLVGNGSKGDTRLGIQALENSQIAGKLVVHNYNNMTDNEIGSNLRVFGSLTATNGIELINDERNITIGSLQNTDALTSNGDIILQAAKNIRNAADIKSFGGKVEFVATYDVINDGVVETTSGSITLHSKNGIVFNDDNADLLSDKGNISMVASASVTDTSADYFYYTTYDENTGEITKVTVPEGTSTEEETQGLQKGRQYVVVNGEKYYVFHNGSVINAGDVVAMQGNILLQSDNGNVANYNDFKAFSPHSIDYDNQYKDKDITTGSITMSAKHGKVINNVDLEAGKDVTIIAEEGLTNFSYKIFAGEDITLTATAGNLVNTSTLESVKGDITLTAEHGNVINGTSTTGRTGDIITLGGTVTLETKGAGHDVINYGDIIAVNKFGGDDVNAGSIVLRSEFGNVNNFDDFNTYSKANGANNYEGILLKNLHGSDTSLAGDISYNLATSNITLSARNGAVNNSLDYLVALGNVTMEAKEGIASLGQVILAGGDIKLADTDSDVFNRAKLISVNGDVTITSEQGAVINMIDGDLIALNGNVTLDAKGTAAEPVQYVVINANNNVETKPLSELLPNVVITEGYIIVTQRGYVDASGSFVELASGEQPPNGNAIKTQIGYLDKAKAYEFTPVSIIAGEAELYRAGDVVNRGDLVALNKNDPTDKGGIKLVSTNGNVANYDEFKRLDDGSTSVYYQGATGYAVGDGNAHFNPGTEYARNESYNLADADLTMKAIEGYLFNTMDMHVKGDITLISGKELLIGINVGNINAGGGVALESVHEVVGLDGSSVKAVGNVNVSGMQGVILDHSGSITAGKDMTLQSEAGTLKATNGSQAVANGNLLAAASNGISVQNAKLQSLNASLSAVATYGDVNISELAAAEMLAAGSGIGEVILGSVAGKSVVLYTEGQGKKITTESIKVDEALVLQGDNISATNVDRSANKGQLIVDITGSAGGAMKGRLDLAVDGDVRFTTTSVTDATINIDGAASFDKLHSEGALHIVSPGMVAGVYGRAPYHDSSNYLYYDLGGNSSSGGHEQIKAEYFTVAKALDNMSKIQDKIDNAANRGQASGNNDGWMYLYIDSPTYQRSNGLLLHIDTGYRSANQRWSAEDLSGKLVDFKSHDAFVAHYSDTVGSFGRYDLLEIAPRSVAQIVQDVTSGKVVLQESNGQLRVAASQDKQDNGQEREERKAANE